MQAEISIQEKVYCEGYLLYDKEERLTEYFTGRAASRPGFRLTNRDFERSMITKMKKRMICTAGVILAVSVTGCGNAIPEMSEQQEELVVEYASDVLLRHSKNYGSKLVDLSLVQEADERKAEMERALAAAKTMEAEAEDTQEDGSEEAAEPENKVEVIDNTGGATSESTPGAASIEEFLQLDSVKISYTGFSTEDFYPDQGEELFFVMNATEGNKLLILKFQTENLSGSELALDIAQSNTRFKIAVNGVEKNALTTLLPNDLANFKGTLNGGESMEMVLVCEVPAEEAGEIASLEVVLKGTEDALTISLD